MVEDKPKNIVIVGPRTEELKNNLEVFIKMMAGGYSDESIIESPDLTSISPLNPETTNLVLYCPSDPSENEQVALRKNYRVPVIKVLSQDRLKEENRLIESFNYFSVVPEPDVNTASLLNRRISTALETKRKTDAMLRTSRGEFLMDDTLEARVQEEVNETVSQRPRPPEAGLLLEPMHMMPISISKFEALYKLLKKQRQTKIINIDSNLHVNLITRVVPNLKLYEKKMHDKQQKGEAALLLKTARDELRSIIAILSDKTKWNEYKVVQTRLGGSTLAEQGSRFLIGAVHRKKYTPKEAEDVYFLRDVYGRKGIGHQTIAQIRYKCSQLFIENEDMGKCASLLPPIPYDNITCILEQGLIGQDFAFVMKELWKRIAQTRGRERGRNVRVKDALEEKYISDLVAWQKNTKKVPQEFAEIQITGEDIAEKYRENLAVLAGSYKNLGIFSAKECLLWNRSLGALTKQNLGITKAKTVLSLDASSMNARINIMQNTASLDEILTEITTEKGEPDAEKINAHFYHIDTGFVQTHILEDFFHIVDAYEVADINAKHPTVIKQLKEKYSGFRKKAEIVEDFSELFLMGAYRNARRAYLVINEFNDKNKKDVLDGTLPKYKYDKDRKKYIDHHKHHIGRTTMYLKELHKHFESRMERQGGTITDLQGNYINLTQMLHRECLSESVINKYVAWFDRLEALITPALSRKKRRYVCSMLYASMANAMAKLGAKLETFHALPKYEDLVKK